MKEAEVVVIGGGPAGYAAATRAGREGWETILVEGRELGGTCLNRGCIPTKVFFKSQEVANLVKRAPDFGIKADFQGIDWETVLSRKNRVVKQLTSGVQFLLQKGKVEIIKGFASFLDSHTVRVEKEGGEKEEIRGKYIILASGSRSAALPVEGANLEGVIDSDQALELSSLPESLVVVGGGVIGMEMACIFNAFGVKVEVVEMMPKILPPVDEEITNLLTQLVEKRGMKVHVNAQVKKIHRSGNLRVTFLQKGEEKEVEGDYVLVATGRVPQVENLGIENLGLKMENRGVWTDEFLRTSIPYLYAPGDVNGKYLLAHVAYKEAEVAIGHIKGEKEKINYKAIPNCIFSFPEIASVGLTEKEAEAQGYEVKVGRFPFRANGKALIEGETEGLVKIVSEAKNGEILGVHILGPHASDLIGEAVLALNLECTPQEIAETIHPHPTLSEALMEAAQGVFSSPLHFS